MLNSKLTLVIFIALLCPLTAKPIKSQLFISFHDPSNFLTLDFQKKIFKLKTDQLEFSGSWIKEGKEITLEFGSGLVRTMEIGGSYLKDFKGEFWWLAGNNVSISDYQKEKSALDLDYPVLYISQKLQSNYLQLKGSYYYIGNVIIDTDSPYEKGSWIYAQDSIVFLSDYPGSFPFSGRILKDKLQFASDLYIRCRKTNFEEEYSALYPALRKSLFTSKADRDSIISWFTQVANLSIEMAKRNEQNNSWYDPTAFYGRPAYLDCAIFKYTQRNDFVDFVATSTVGYGTISARFVKDSMLVNWQFSGQFVK